MTALQSADGPRISRRALLQRASALGLTAASGAWLEPAQALAAPATHRHRTAQPRMAAADHLVVDYLPSQPTGWGGVTIGGHVASVPFTFQGKPYAISLLAFGQTGSAPDPVYEPEPSDPTIDFKRTLQKAWGAHYSFRYRGGFRGHSKISVQSYNVRHGRRPRPSPRPPQPTRRHAQQSRRRQLRRRSVHRLRARPEPPAILRSTTICGGSRSCIPTEGRSSTATGATPTTPAPGSHPFTASRCATSTTAPEQGVGTGAQAKARSRIANQEMFETFLVQDTGHKDRAGKGIIDIYGGIKWGWHVQAGQS